MKSRLGIVLEGGAMRGLFTAGVLDELMYHDIIADGAIGVSAGAAFGVNYKSRQSGRVLRYNMHFAHDKRLSSWESWLKTGDLYGADFCYRELPVELDVFDTNEFQKNPMDFWCVATDIQTGAPVYHKLILGESADLQWIRASSSIPVFAKPVKIGSRLYWDGGVSDSIPVKFMEKMGYDKLIVVLTQPASYRKKNSKIYPLLRVILHSYPQVLKRLKTRNFDYNETLNYIQEQKENGNLFVIHPQSALKIGTMEKDPQELKRVYLEGRKVVNTDLGQLQKYLKIKNPK